MATILPTTKEYQESSSLIHENSHSGFWDSKPGKITAIALLIIASIPVVTAPVTLYFAYQIWTDLNKDEGLPSVFFTDDNKVANYDDLGGILNAVEESLSHFSPREVKSAALIHIAHRKNEQASIILPNQEISSRIDDIDQFIFPSIVQAVRDRKQFVFIPLCVGSDFALITLDFRGKEPQFILDNPNNIDIRGFHSCLQIKLMNNLEWGKQLMPYSAQVYDNNFQRMTPFSEEEKLFRQEHGDNHWYVEYQIEDRLPKALRDKGEKINPFQRGFSFRANPTETVYEEVKAALDLSS